MAATAMTTTKVAAVVMMMMIIVPFWRATTLFLSSHSYLEPNAIITANQPSHHYYDGSEKKEAGNRINFVFLIH